MILRPTILLLFLTTLSTVAHAQSTLPTTLPATFPTTLPATTPAIALPATGPATGPATSAPTLGATTEAAATTGPASTQPTSAPLAAVNPATNPTSNPTTHPNTVAQSQPTTPVAATQPAKPPAVATASTPPAPMRPAGTFGWKPITSEYAVLGTRSIFYKGRFVPAAIATEPSPSHDAPTSQPDGGAAAAETEIVFDGVTDGDNEYAAFLENRADQKVSIVRVGDAIALGKITAITLDQLDYETAGKTVQVRIGQNLRGQTASPSSTSQPALAAGAPPGAAPPSIGTPAAASSTPQTIPGVSNDLLERLRQRRLRELQGK